jgi:hypothetical protein
MVLLVTRPQGNLPLITSILFLSVDLGSGDVNDCFVECCEHAVSPDTQTKQVRIRHLLVTEQADASKSRGFCKGQIAWPKTVVFRGSVCSQDLNSLAWFGGVTRKSRIRDDAYKTRFARVQVAQPLARCRANQFTASSCRAWLGQNWARRTFVSNKYPLIRLRPPGEALHWSLLWANLPEA